MAVPQTIIDFLAEQEASYSVSHHPHTSSSWQTVIATHSDPACFAKGILLHDNEGYFLAVVPASKRLDVKVLTEQFGHRPELVTEAELARIFPDCETGAVPALGAAYGLDCVVDESLHDQEVIVLEAGDHEDVIELQGEVFAYLMANARWGAICEPEDD